MTFLRSIIITVLVALGFAFGLRNILGFWETFALAVVFQFLAVDKINEIILDIPEDLAKIAI